MSVVQLESCMSIASLKSMVLEELNESLYDKTAILFGAWDAIVLAFWHGRRLIHHVDGAVNREYGDVIDPTEDLYLYL